ncbi:sensor domain-containing diguanylate cyclase [Heyndrickxia camelliae]|uniref:GGDEF domain-containing protein n=1 Tax=Heyndrickxia camelliae TaxID=1707093 RepID=A0A2N3LPG9_9BACI|nr:sensor domain-containing diguanylate cyclase [Heyndrickxia camelliae]PKR86521.1 GGDEF domain-containing protein [Heyndrickxia camelliae]
MVNYDVRNAALEIVYESLKRISTEHGRESKEDYSTIKNQWNENHRDKLMEHIFSQLDEIQDQMERLNWLNSHYRILHNFAQICSKTLSEEILFKETYQMVSQVMPTDSFYIATYNEGDSEIQVPFMIDRGKKYPSVTIGLGENHTSQAIKTREIIHHKESRMGDEYDVYLGDEDAGLTSSCLFVPVIIDNQVKGVISAQSYAEFAYRKEHEELLQIIGTQVFSSIDSIRLYEHIYKISQLDELTDLKNYRAFHEDLSSLISQSNQIIQLIMLDSDSLKRVNDRFGHDIGDRYLKVLADGIKTICDKNIEGYRYAGDEFMVIVKSAQKIMPLYEKIKEYYEHHPITIGSEQIYVSISTGVSEYPKHGNTVDLLKKSADTALYTAKKQGGNQIVFTT